MLFVECNVPYTVSLLSQIRNIEPGSEADLWNRRVSGSKVAASASQVFSLVGPEQIAIQPGDVLYLFK
jgi:hypothetical protein